LEKVEQIYRDHFKQAIIAHYDNCDTYFACKAGDISQTRLAYFRSVIRAIYALDTSRRTIGGPFSRGYTLQN